MTHRHGCSCRHGAASCRKCVQWALILISIWAVPEGRATDGLEPIGVGARANARGGADVAVGDSALSQIENPALLSLRRRDSHEFDAEGEIALADAHYRGAIDSASSTRRLVPLGNMAVSVPLDEQWTLGLALHSKAGLGTTYRLRHLMIPFVERRVGGDLKVLDPQVNFAWKASDKLALGAGARVEVATTEFSTVLGPLDLDVSRGYAAGAGFQAGLLYKPRDDLAFGLAYRSSTWCSDVSGGSAKASLFGALPIDLGGVRIPDLTLPQRISAGLAWDATDRLKLTAETRWFNYSATTFNHTDVRTDGRLDLRYPFPMGYRDQWAWIVGAEYRLGRNWVAAGGYHYATAPIDRAHMLPMGSTISQHHVTLGLRYETEKWWVGAAYGLALPASLAGNGRSAVPLAFDSAFGEIRQTQHVISMGFGYRW